MICFREDSRSRRAIAAALAFYMVWAPTSLAWADAMSDQGAAGQAAGAAAAGNVSQPSAAAGNVSQPSAATGGVFALPGGSAGTQHISAQQLFPDAGRTDLNVFTQKSGDAPGARAAGVAARGRLTQEDSATGDAYRTMVEQSNRSRPDMRADPIWGRTDDVIANMPAITALMADCTSTPQLTPASSDVILHDTETCERTPPQSDQCTIRRVVDSVSGPKPCAAGTDLGTATTKFGVVSLSCNGKFGQVNVDWGANRGGERVGTAANDVTLPGSVTLGSNAPHFDTVFNGKLGSDVSRIAGGDAVVMSMTDTGGAISLDFTKTHIDYRQQCTPNDRGPDTCYTEISGFFQEKAHAAVGGFVLQPPSTVTHIEDTPRGCSTAGLCKAQAWDCTASGSVTFDGTVVDAGFDGLVTLYPDAAKSCWEAKANGYACDPFAAIPTPICVDAGQGGDTCINWDQIKARNECAPLEADPNCGFISSKCVEGFRDAVTGACLLFTDTFDCEQKVAVPTAKRAEKLTCAGPVRCMGGDCVKQSKTASGDFARAAAFLQAAQFITMDNDCTAANAGNCKVFSGGGYKCKKLIAGIVDCCKKGRGVSLGDYLKLVGSIGQIDKSIMNMDPASAVRGSWETLRTPFTSAWSEVKKPFVSAADSLVGQVAPKGSDLALGAALSGVQQAMMTQVASWTAQVFGTQAANSLFSVVTSAGDISLAFTSTGQLAGGALQLGGGQAFLGNALGYAMTAYTIASVAITVIKIIFSCKQRELELAAKRPLRVCHYVGAYCSTKVLFACLVHKKSYCCFNSPLSRIIQEQVRPQLGMPWGAAKTPDCGGIPASRLGAVDWDRVNLDEWLALLQLSGNLPRASQVDIDRLTGPGSLIGRAVPRANANIRTATRAAGLDAADIRQQAKTELLGVVTPAAVTDFKGLRDQAQSDYERAKAVHDAAAADAAKKEAAAGKAEADAAKTQADADRAAADAARNLVDPAALVQAQQAEADAQQTVDDATARLEAATTALDNALAAEKAASDAVTAAQSDTDSAAANATAAASTAATATAAASAKQAAATAAAATAKATADAAEKGYRDTVSAIWASFGIPTDATLDQFVSLGWCAPSGMWLSGFIPLWSQFCTTYAARAPANRALAGANAAAAAAASGAAPYITALNAANAAVIHANQVLATARQALADARSQARTAADAVAAAQSGVTDAQAALDDASAQLAQARQSVIDARAGSASEIAAAKQRAAATAAAVAQQAAQAAAQARARAEQARSAEQSAAAQMSDKADALHKTQVAYDYAKRGAATDPP